MPSFLQRRQPNLTEQMDRDNCDSVLLKNTYLQFPLINQLLSQWKRIYKNELRPLMSENRTYSVLDIGFGGGDVPVKLAKWAKEDKIQLNITAIDTDRRAFDFVQKKYPEGLITWKHASSTDLVLKKAQFDFVISNHLLHHLKDSEVSTLLREARELAAQKVIFNDIERSETGYFLFNTFSRLIFKNSFITQDGLTSIKRSFTRNELEKLVPSSWKVKRMLPFRLLLIYERA
ncbi:MAG TPA: methyltransferase domain-containing protein [Gracilimonas sp.]|uniref:methyltransferase domain-containing protein n=1 Tax=Gracilimonas sp. TaxID=1974203 RepID=UPI002DA86C35|nr:methyltransferase domain-containing protein [Gracilimonas sp.]